jgi:polyhydroxyalkanoate synthesis regulator phasin
MPAPKPSSASSRSKAAAAKPKTAALAKAKPAAKKPAARTTASKSAAAKTAATRKTAAKAPGKTASARTPIDLVVLTRDRIQETLDEAVERGRVTSKDANDLVDKLFKQGRKQTDDLVAEIERRVKHGREQLESATRKARRAEPVDRIVRTADRARRTVGVGPSFPILGYDDLTANQVNARLGELKAAALRKVREYERKHANRKSVLEAVEKALA